MGVTKIRSQCRDVGTIKSTVKFSLKYITSVKLLFTWSATFFSYVEDIGYITQVQFYCHYHRYHCLFTAE